MENITTQHLRDSDSAPARVLLLALSSPSLIKIITRHDGPCLSGSPKRCLHAKAIESYKAVPRPNVTFIETPARSSFFSQLVASGLSEKVKKNTRSFSAPITLFTNSLAPFKASGRGV